MNRVAIAALLRSVDVIANLPRHMYEPDDGEFHSTPLITGSVAELNIDPLLSCIGDTDIMYHNTFELVIPAGCSPPTRLPVEFDRVVWAGEIVDSELPGYVYLMRSGLLIKHIEDSEYYFLERERTYASYGSSSSDKMHGPARVVRYSRNVPDFPKDAQRDHLLDEVYCVRCLSWPPQADDWPTRQRNYGWPNSANVDHVVSDGCDVVPVAHRVYRHDEWKNSCLLYTSPSPRDGLLSRMPSSA